ncbi:unnamed protein product [Arctia plantaginis]|uniref:C2H2-type domain-containing protein n=1 Tax=Arctia plantaginis TaxID=874455 RepID=A0A8S1BUS5_ARCPL|nr:unnamed protein product [Arctia plantaginis]CAB3262347.1 unnamed protein product [Arctia plantaginis]
MAKRNASIVLQYSTAYPFRYRGNVFLCAYCSEGYEDPIHLRRHINCNHQKFKVSRAFGHTSSGKDYLKVDCTDLKCRLCFKSFLNLEEVARHLIAKHDCKDTRQLCLDYDIGMQPYKLVKDNWICFLCEFKFPTVTKLCRHMSSHYQEYTCEVCGTALEIHGRRNSANEPKKKIVLVYQPPQRRNAELILTYSTAYPFKTRFSQILCSYCHEEYSTLSDLRYHMKVEHINSDFKNVFYRAKDNLIKIDITNLKCTICTQEIQDIDGLMSHLYSVHNKPVKFNARYGVLPYKQSSENQWICIYCNKILNAFISFKRHIVTHFMNYTCDKCGTMFVSDHALRDHHRQVKCFRAAYKARNGRVLKPRTNAEIILQCSTASPFRTWKSNFNCVFCRVQSNDPSSLRLHVVTAHANYDVKAAFYKKLGKDFLNIDITDLQCKLCFMPIDTFENLIYHLKNDHQQPINDDAQLGVLPFRLNDGSIWKCTICPNEFKDFVSLKKHTSEHFQNYVCDTCGEGFITESAMIAHTKIPHENKYNCSRCIATFSSLDERNLHVKTQHTSMPYMCVYCKEKPRFANWEVRKKHLMAVHNYKTGADKYECTTCQKSFKTRSGKYNHMARVHRIKKDSELNYPCPSCPKAFTTKLFLDKHVAKKHIDV